MKRPVRAGKEVTHEAENMDGKNARKSGTHERVTNISFSN